MDKRRLRDQLQGSAIATLAILVLLAPLSMLLSLGGEGLQLLDWEFLSQAPRDAGRAGGIAPLLFSTAWILAVCMTAVLSLGTACALYLNEPPDQTFRMRRRVSVSLDILAGVPSIVFGLFGYLFFAQLLGLGFSIASGGLTLACMALPLYVRLAQQALAQVPASYRQAGEALDLSQLGFVRRILLPAAAPGLAAAVIISAGRALAETAVLIFTAGYVTRMPESWLDSGRALSVHIYDLAMNVPGGSAPAAATALVLLALLILFNIAARALARRWQQSNA